MAQDRSTKIISIMKWIRTSRLSIMNSLSLQGPREAGRERAGRACRVRSASSTCTGSCSVLWGIRNPEPETKPKTQALLCVLGLVPREQKMLKGHTYTSPSILITRRKWDMCTIWVDGLSRGAEYALPVRHARVPERYSSQFKNNHLAEM